jgi:hypothetical protein
MVSNNLARHLFFSRLLSLNQIYAHSQCECRQAAVCCNNKNSRQTEQNKKHGIQPVKHHIYILRFKIRSMAECISRIWVWYDRVNGIIRSICKKGNTVSVFQRLSIYTRRTYFCINKFAFCINSTKLSINM